MAVIARIATIVLSSGLGNRTFRAEAAVQDTPAGDAVTITITQATDGTSPPVLPNSFVLRLRVDNSATNIRSYTLTPSSTNQSVSFSFTADGTTAAAIRCGTVRLRLEAIKNNGLASENYNVNSDDTAGQVLPTGYTVTTRDQGWVRGTTSATIVTSNVAFAGAKPDPYAYTSAGGDTIFHRTILGAAPFIARTLTAMVGSVLSATSSTSSGTNFDTTFANVVDNRFTAGLTSHVCSAAPQNAALTGQPFTTFSTTTNDTINVDPRITRTPHFQLDDDDFGTPPSTKHDSSFARLTSQTGFLASRTTNARGEGVNGITYNVTLTPSKPGDAITETGLITQSQGGEAGWPNKFTVWASQLPAGIWTKSVAITAPSDITGTGYMVQNGGTDYTLLAVDPRITLFVAGGNLSDISNHWQPTKSLTIGVALQQKNTKINITTGSAYVALSRFNPALGTTEHLNADMEWVTGDTAYEHQLTVSAGDPKLALITFSGEIVKTTAPANKVWGMQDIFITATAKTPDGTPYYGQATIEVTGRANPHSGYKFDPTGVKR